MISKKRKEQKEFFKVQIILKLDKNFKTLENSRKEYLGEENLIDKGISSVECKMGDSCKATRYILA